MYQSHHVIVDVQQLSAQLVDGSFNVADFGIRVVVQDGLQLSGAQQSCPGNSPLKNGFR